MSQPSSFWLFTMLPVSSPLLVKSRITSGLPRRSASSCGVMSACRYWYSCTPASLMLRAASSAFIASTAVFACAPVSERIAADWIFIARTA